MSIEVSLKHPFGPFVLDAAFKLDRPGVTALFGPSGAGKTSIVQAIAGLLQPEEGRIVVNGRVVLDTGRGLSVPASARRIGYVFQDSRLFPHMSVEDNLLFGWRRAKSQADSREISHVIELLGLEHLIQRRPRNLSGGERQRTALGRALLSSPELLLLDEPMAALDLARRSEILPYLERLRDEARLPMLYVSHAVDEVARLADEIVVLRDGRVQAQGSVFELMPMLDAAAGSLIRAEIAQHRPDSLSELKFAGGTLLVPRLAREAGARLRVRIAATDIMLAKEEPRAISANNVLSCLVFSVADKTGAHVDVTLLCGPTQLVARITRSSAERLGIFPGVPVFAIVKAVTVDPQVSA
jgi:molybdate transport system ATP-binding protein